MVELPTCLAGALADVIQDSERVLVQFERMRSQLDGLVRQDGLPLTRTAMDQLATVVESYQKILVEVRGMAVDASGEDKLQPEPCKALPLAQVRLEKIREFRSLAFQIQQQIEDLKKVFWLELDRIKHCVRWQQRRVRSFKFDCWMLAVLVVAWFVMRWFWKPVDPV
eukprot:jgi/Ulvmu1/9882/UM057_0037.1